MATECVSSRDFLNAGAFVRGYCVALGIAVPQLVDQIVFGTSEVFPPYAEIWKTDFYNVFSLASILSWRLCLSAFEDIYHFEPSVDQQERYRQLLMSVAGNTFPPSNRAQALIKRYGEQEEQVVQGVSSGVVTVRFRIINECIDGPDLSVGMIDPREKSSMVVYLEQLFEEAERYFRNNALEISCAHSANGMRVL